MVSLNQTMTVHRKKMTKFLMFAVLFIALSGTAQAQLEYASPSNWMFPDGNPEGTHYQKIISQPQPLNYFAIKKCKRLH